MDTKLKNQDINGSLERLGVICYVITAKGFNDRQISIEEQAKAQGLRINYILDYDVTDLSTEALSQVDQQKLPLPSISTVLKHLLAQQRLLDSEAKYALILEDDVLFFDNFKERLVEIIKKLPALKRFLIFLGGSDGKINSSFLKKDRNELIEFPISTAEAYIVDRDSAIERLGLLKKRIIDLPADHLLKTVDAELGITQYWLASPLTTQGSITGKFVSKLDENRKKHSQRYLRYRYLINRIRRQFVYRAFGHLILQCKLLIESMLRK